MTTTTNAQRGTFGDFLRAKREAAGLSAPAVAESCGWKLDRYLRIEKGMRSYLRTEEYRLLAQALGLTGNEVARKAQEAGY